MVMLVWWILSLFRICSFGWLPVMIDAIIATIASFAISNGSGDERHTAADMLCISALGVAVYAFCAQFLSLSLPFWCVFISPIWFFVAALFPGGFTITNIILNSATVMNVPIWVFIVGCIADAIIIAFIIGEIVSSVRNK